MGCFKVCQWRNAFRRNSNSHSGSSFFFEMRRMMSSFKPFGAKSVSMSVTKPYSYSLLVTSLMIFSFGF